ncbi:MAG: hypothetical protein HRT89_09530, partial [Lentisphaeria bacterium]|nr:hypothetical protein [Lentisphaeria bacterium]
ILGAGDCIEAEDSLRTILDERLKLYRAVLKKPTTWKKTAAKNLYGWYYDTQAMFNQGGRPWKKWRKVFEPVLIKAQNPKGYWETGKGEGLGPSKKGRILATCWVALQLEVFYRYKKIKKK